MESDDIVLGQDAAQLETSNGSSSAAEEEAASVASEEAQDAPEATEPDESTDHGEDVADTPEESTDHGEDVADTPDESTDHAEDVADTPEEPHPMQALLDEDFALQALKRGKIVEGTIVSIGRDEILVDIGGKSDGVVGSRDIERLDAETLESLHVGDTITVHILSLEDRNGNVLLSIARALEQQDWITAEQYYEEQTSFEGDIVGFNKGGLLVSFGRLSAFVPASQIGSDRRRRSSGDTPDQRWGDMMNETIVVKVIEINRSRNRLIVSERATEKEHRAAQKAELMTTLEVGQVHTGSITSLADFGAFVDLGGIDGLVHVSELAWKPVGHPSDVLAVGDEIEVEVISLDHERQRVGLSRKRRLDDPWISIVAQYEAGQLVQGVITKLTKFGAFARLVETPEIEGLIHISELSEQRINHPSDVVEENQVLTLRIVRIDPERRRIGLSLKRVDSEDYLDSDWNAPSSEASVADDSDDIAEDEVEAEAIADDSPADESEEAEVEAEAAADESATDESTEEAEVEAEAIADDSLADESEEAEVEAEAAADESPTDESGEEPDQITDAGDDAAEYTEERENEAE